MTNFTRDYAKKEDVELTDTVLNGSVSGTAIKDDDYFWSPSSTTLASSESIKAYVDRHTGPKYITTYSNGSDTTSLTWQSMNSTYKIYYVVLEGFTPTTDASLLMQLAKPYFGGPSFISTGYRQMTYFLGQTNSDTWESSYLTPQTNRQMWSICGGYNNNNLRVDSSTTHGGYYGTWRIDNAQCGGARYPKITMIDQITYRSSAGYTMGYMYAYKNMWCEGFGTNNVSAGRIYFSAGYIRAGAKIHVFGANYETSL